MFLIRSYLFSAISETKMTPQLSEKPFHFIRPYFIAFRTRRQNMRHFKNEKAPISRTGGKFGRFKTIGFIAGKITAKIHDNFTVSASVTIFFECVFFYPDRLLLHFRCVFAKITAKCRGLKNPYETLVRERERDEFSHFSSSELSPCCIIIRPYVVNENLLSRIFPYASPTNVRPEKL